MKHISEKIKELPGGFINQPIGISTGYYDLDQAIWGLQPQQLIVVGGRPAMGKTAILTDIALESGKEALVGIFSLEMPYERLQARMCCNLADLNYRNVRAGKITEQEKDKFIAASEILAVRELYVDDEPGIIGTDEYWLRQRNIHLKRTMDYKLQKMVEKGCKVILVDYLQLIAYTNASIKDRRIIVGNIAEMLRGYAKQYNICVILLSQLRRFEQGRYGTGKKKISPMPTLDDLKESGEIENHSDVVVLLHRPQYYTETKDMKLTENIIEDDAVLMVRKNRDGPTGNIPVEWHSFSMSYRSIGKNERGF